VGANNLVENCPLPHRKLTWHGLHP
jgi:hypothetical protein